jgi:hypothetical protein
LTPGRLTGWLRLKLDRVRGARIMAAELGVNLAGVDARCALREQIIESRRELASAMRRMGGGS